MGLEDRHRDENRTLVLDKAGYLADTAGAANRACGILKWPSLRLDSSPGGDTHGFGRFLDEREGSSQAAGSAIACLLAPARLGGNRSRTAEIDGLAVSQRGRRFRRGGLPSEIYWTRSHDK